VAIKVILNPAAGRGYGSKAEPLIQGYLQEAGLDFELARTRGLWDAAELAQRAAEDGFDLVVAAGGDGTSNEVVNGLLAAGEGVSAAMGVLPVGTGSDFANAVGVPPDLREACLRLRDGQRRLVDVGLARLPGQAPRYFANALGIGFEGVLTVEARKFKHLRGMALYLPAVLKTTFVSFKVPTVTITVDGERLELPALMVCIANGPREGGGFFVAPGAQPDDGLFDICIARKVSKLGILGLLPHYMKGTHVGRDPIRMLRTTQIVVSSPDDLAAHMDGELLCVDGHEIACQILPQRLPVVC